MVPAQPLAECFRNQQVLVFVAVWFGLNLFFVLHLDWSIEGVAAAESADNAVVPASLIPLFALGIPGSVIAAILISALVLHGLTPGPLMFQQQPQKVGDLYAALLCASVILLAIGYAGQRLFALVIRVPLRLIIPGVLFLCCVGAYMETSSVFSIYLMLVFTLIGYFMRKFEYSFVTFLIGFVIGPNLELTFRQSIQLLDGKAANLVHHPISIVFILLTVITVGLIARGNSRATQRAEARAGMEKPKEEQLHI